MGSIINYLIGLIALAFTIYRMKIKSQENPHYKIGGLSIKSLIKLAYLGVICYVTLVVLILVKAY